MADVEDTEDISKNIQSALSELAAGPMQEVADLSKLVRDNFLDANSAANIEITGEDTLAKMAAQLTGIKKGYQTVDGTLVSVHTNLNGITDREELLTLAKEQQASIQQRIDTGKADEAKLTDDIADQQRAVLMAEQARAAVPFESDEYKEYSEIIKEANRAIIEQQGHVTGLQAQHAGLQGIHDGYLATIIEEVNAGKSINEITATRRQLQRNNLDLSAAQVDLIDQQQKELERLGPGMDDYIKRWGTANDAIMGSFDSIADGISDTLGSLPLVGGLLKAHVEGPLKAAAEESKKSWQSFTEGMQDDMSGVNGEALSFADAMKNNIGQLGGAIGGMGKAIMSAIFNPFTLILVLIGGFILLMKSAFDELMKLENAAREFRFQFGMSAETAARLAKDAFVLQEQFKHLGLYAEDFLKAGAALTEVFGSVHYVSKEATAFVGLMSMATGVTEESMAGAMNTLAKLGATTEKEMKGILMSVHKLAQGYGLNMAKIMDDIANASEEALLFAKGSAKAMANAAFHARRYGSSLDDVASSSAQLLDFESSVSAQMKAQTLFGRSIDLSAMRRAAWEGDTQGLLNERTKLMSRLGGLEKMNRFQQQALAEAMGTSVDQLYEMEKIRKSDLLLQKLANQGVAWAVEAQNKRDKADREAAARKNMSSAELAKLAEKDLEQLIKKTLEMEKMNNFMNQLKAAWHSVKTALMPIASALMPILVDLVEQLGEYMKRFYTVTESADGPVTELTDEGKDLKKTFEGILDTVKTLGSTLMWAFENPITAMGAVLGILIAIKFASAAISAAAASMFGGGGGGGAGGTLFGMSPKTMMSAAFSLLLMAGAVYVFALALEKLKDVGLDELGLALGGLAGMMGGLFAIGQIMAKFPQAQLIQGAFAIMLLGASLIPFAFAMNLLKDVGIGEFFLAAAGITVLGIAGAALGAFAPLTIAGAFALLLLSLAFIPLGYGLSLVTPLVEAFGAVFVSVVSLVVDAINLLIDGVVKLAEVLAGFVLGILDRVVQGFKILGDVVVAVANSIAGIITSVGDAIVSVITGVADAIVSILTGVFDVISGFITSIAEGIALVIDSVAGAITAMVDDIIRLSEIDAGNLFQVGLAIGTIGAAMAGFGVGSAVGKVADSAGGFFSGLINKGTALVTGQDEEELNKSPLQKLLDFAAEADDIIAVADKMDLLLNSFDRLAEMDDTLESAAENLELLGGAMYKFGMGLDALAGGGEDKGFFGNMWDNMFGGEEEKQKGPMEQLLDFIGELSVLEDTAPQLDSFVLSLDKLAGMTESLLASSEALHTLGLAFEAFGTGLSKLTGGGEEKKKGFFGSMWDNMFGEDEDTEKKKGPMEQLLDFIGELSVLEVTAPQLDSFVLSLEKLSGMTDSLVASSEALHTLGTAFAAFGTGLSKLTGGGEKKQTGFFGRMWDNMFGEPEEKQKGPMEQLLDFIGELSVLGEIAPHLDTFVGAFERLGSMSDSLQTSADGIRSMGSALMMFTNAILYAITSMSIASTVRGVSGWLSGLFGKEEQEDPLDQLFGFIDKLSVLGDIGTQMDTFVSSLEQLGGMTMIQEKLFPFFDALSQAPIAQMSEDISFLLDNLGSGIYQFFDRLSATDFTALPFLPEMQSSLIPFLTAFGGLKLPADNAGEILESLGAGLEEFADFVNDGEGRKISKFFKDSGRGFTDFIKGMANISRVGKLSIIDQLKALGSATGAMGPENLAIIENFSSVFVLKMSEMKKASDPLVTNLQSIATNLGKISEMMKTLPIEKMASLLKLIPADAVNQIPQAPDDNGTKGPPGPKGPSGPDGETVVEGTIPAKFVEVAPPTVGEFFLAEDGSVTDLSNRSAADIQRDEEREEHFRNVYPTADAISNKIERQQTFLAEEIAKVVDDPVGTKRIQHGVDLVNRDIAILEKIKMDMQPTTPSLADIFSAPMTGAVSAATQQLPQHQSPADIFSAPPTEILEQTTTLTPNQPLQQGATAGENLPVFTKITRIFNALDLFTDDSFISGLSRATSTITSFANAIGGLSELKLNILASISKIATTDETLETGFNSTLSDIQDGVGSTPVDVELINDAVKPSQLSSDKDMNTNIAVVKKLNELILLMRKGGIAVHLDGKKVSKAVAGRED